MKKNILLDVFFVVVIAVNLIIGFFDITFAEDIRLNYLVSEIVSKSLLGALLTVIVYVYFKKEVSCYQPIKSYLIVLPCILVILANFPFSALINKTAEIERYDLLCLFIIDCALIGITEELFFRAIIHSYVKSVMLKKKNGYLYSVLISSAIFGLFHLVNLFAGAGFAPTVLQVSYSFLLGCMLSCVFDKTGNVWVCAGLHALFDFGGKFVEMLGHGEFQDKIFWILTVVCGVICAVFIAYSVLKNNKKINGEIYGKSSEN